MKKRILSLFLVMVMVLGILPAPAMAEEVTAIDSQEKLAAMTGGSNKLTADIELSPDWTAISSFAGTLDGNGHTITLNGKPLFETILSGATVSNLILRGSVTSDSSVGSLAVKNGGTVRNCVSYAAVSYTGNGGGWDTHGAAGLVGLANTKSARVQNCVYAGTLDKGNAQAYGAIMNNGEFVTGTVTKCVGVGTDRIGTSVGYFENTPIDVGDNHIVEDAAAFDPAAYLDELNANRSEGDLAWVLSDGQLVLEIKEGSVEEATQEDLQKLADAIKAAEAVDKTQIYTASSWEALNAALETANKLSAAPKKPQKDVLDATTQLTEKVEAMQPRSFDTVLPDGMTVVEVTQENYKDTLKTPKAGNYYKLTEDISVDFWNAATEMNAVLDGDGHTITLNGAILYGTIGAEGVIQNLGILGSAQNDSNDTGALAKDCSGLIINCWSRAAVSSEGQNHILKNTGSFTANVLSGGAIINSLVAGKVSAKGNSGEGRVGALAGSAQENTLIKNGYFEISSADNTVGSSSGIVTESGSKTKAELADKGFLESLNANKGSNGKQWNLSPEGLPYFGEAGDYTPDAGVVLKYVPNEGIGNASSTKEFDSKQGIVLTLEDVLPNADQQNTIQYAGIFSYPDFEGEVAFVPQYANDGQGRHKVFVSENGALEVLGTGSLTVAVCDKASWSGTQYEKELARFMVTVTGTDVQELRLVPTGKYVTDKQNGTYEVAGSGAATIKAQVRLGDSWKVAPADMVSLNVEGNVSLLKNTFRAKEPGKIAVTGNGFGKTARVEVISTYVPVSSIVPGPSGTYVIHERNANSDGMADFLDLTLSHQAGSVVIQPENASYSTDWTLESSDPTVADYIPSMVRAVLPYQAGTVTLTAKLNDPKQAQPVVGTSEITLKYFNPVTSVEIQQPSLSVKENETIDLPLSFNGPKTENGYHVSEPGMKWSFSGSGEVEIVRDAASLLVKNEKEYCVANDQYQLIGIKEGVVTVTGTPVDQTGNAKPVTFTVTVESGVAEPPADNDKIIAEGTAGALGHLQQIYADWQYRFGDEWAVFIFTRTGNTLTEQQKQAYLDSIVKTYEKPRNANLKPTTLARVILTVTTLGEDASNLRGIDLIELLCRGKFMADGGNEPMWALIALDSGNYQTPANAKWDRDALVKEVLSYQNTENGGFGLTDNKRVSVDMTAMGIQALANYHNSDEAVKTAVEHAVTYLKHEMNRNCDYGTSESISEVIIALTALGRDPLDKSNGFVKSDARNLFTGLDAYRLDGGFKHVANQTQPDNMATTQALMAFESYRRLKAGENALYEIVSKETPDKPVDPDKPTEPKPTEPKPTEPKPTEPKPTESKPTESKPAEAGTKPTTPGAKPNTPNHNRPATGDNSNMMLYMIVMAVAGGMIVVTLILTGKKKTEREMNL